MKCFDVKGCYFLRQGLTLVSLFLLFVVVFLCCLQGKTVPVSG